MEVALEHEGPQSMLMHWGQLWIGFGAVVFAPSIILSAHVVAQSLELDSFESVQPCSLEQYVAPSSESELSSLRNCLKEDVSFAFQAGEKDLVLSMLCQGAAAGIAGAEMLLGGAVAEGWGMFEKDEERARYWLKRATDRGDMHGALLLSVLYRMGRGGPVMGSEGISLLRASANAGNSDAQYELAAEYVRGDFVPADRGLAMRWAALAANAGHQDAKKLLHRLDNLKRK